MPDASNSKITIINKALSHIKQRTITSLDEQSEQARKANLFYDCARKSALRGCDWRWATVKKPLVLLGDLQTATAYPDDNSKQDVIPPWYYTYAYPATCVRLRKIFNVDALSEAIPISVYYGLTAPLNIKRIEFEVARSPVTNTLAVATNMQDASAEFTFDIIDESQFDDMFQDALAWQLAADLAMPLSCDKELVMMVKAQADEAMAEARRKNGGEGTEMLPRQSNYEAARNEGGYSRDGGSW